MVGWAPESPILLPILRSSFCVLRFPRFRGPAIAAPRGQVGRAWSVPAWVVVFACCVLPLGWMLVQVARHPGSVTRVVPTAFYAGLLGRTLAYSVAVAVLATVLALPAALALGRSRGRFAAALWLLLPAALLMPSVTYAYGWQLFLRGLGVELELAGAADVLRCVATLATWLWPIPAGVLALALRRVDPDVQQQALLDGAPWRVTARQLAGPVAAGMACVVVLASQEFAVYEPTGISVVATEVRMVFETGAFSSPDNPITASFIGGGAAQGQPDAPDAADPADAVPPSTQGASSLGVSDQNARAGAAVATSLPLLVVAAIIGALGLLGVRKFSATTEELHVSDTWPRALEAGAIVKSLALVIVLFTLLTPALAMIASLHVRRSPAVVWQQFSPQAMGSIVLACCTALVAGLVAFTTALRPKELPAALSLAAFLIGGQLLAIALIRLYNRPAPWPLGLVHFGSGGDPTFRRDAFDLIYNGIPIVVMAYLARFGWLALLAGNLTRSAPWRQVRELLALDGASPAQAARHVVWPLAWPVLLASALLVGVLALTEVPATVLISPLRPQPLIPMLMGWVHIQRYDDMILGSLLLMSMALVGALVAAGLIAVGMRLLRWTTAPARLERPAMAIAGLSVMLLGVAGCSDASQPEEMWLQTGTAPGQVVYPRAITYSPNDDSFFVVDRLARIQHIDARGNHLNGWRMPDWRIGKPVGLSVGPDGNVYVPDTHYHRIVVYSPDGKELRRWGTRGTEPGQFIWPTDVAFDKDGNVYVPEYGDNDRIQVFASDGKFLHMFGSFGDGPGQFMRPQSIVIDDNDMIYVADACNHRIGVFKLDGTFVRNFGSSGSALGQFRFPYGIDEDKDGRLVVCEFGNNRLQLVDKETGKGLETWGRPGREPGQLAYPWAVALDKAGRVVAVDSGNNRLQVFEF